MASKNHFDKEELEAEISWLHSMVSHSNGLTQQDAEKIAKEIILSKRELKKEAKKSKQVKIRLGVKNILNTLKEHKRETYSNVVERLAKQYKEQQSIKFTQGTVSALDIVALHGEGQIFKDIVEANGKDETLAEIMKNGMDKTKAMAKLEFRLR